MLRYYLTLGVRSLRRNPVLTGLMILTLAVGVAASISTLTILHVMSGDPIPHKSARLIVPLLDNGPLKTYEPGKKDLNDAQMSYRDAMNLLASGQGVRRTALYDIFGSIEPARPDLPVIDVQGIAATSDYFTMFEVPFRFGGPWTAADDKAATRAAVLSRRKAEAIFGKDDPVGRRFRLGKQDYTVAGVLDEWNPVPRYTHLINGSGGTFRGEDEIFIPFSAAVATEQANNGSMNCPDDPGPGFQGILAAECTWIQFWFELGSSRDRAALKDYLDGYTREQHRLGRFERQAPNRTFDVMEWMDYLEVVHNDNRLAVWLAFGFLLLCMVNTMGLLLAKFSARASEIGVRRALGASRGAIFRQFLIETGVIGLAGGGLGLLLSFLSLWLIRLQSRDLSAVAHMDWEMLGTTFAIAVGASVCAGLLPTWRACQITPALQLKSQ
ncbi:FtsX-like permease family protein [Oxalobacteraceae bacterium OM1]|nr:FtsX-like permease family protein [Oxalobacteraceae bacterium OM1]